jgi:hypothetical protein
MMSEPTRSDREVLAGLVERVTYQNVSVRAAARSSRAAAGFVEGRYEDARAPLQRLAGVPSPPSICWPICAMAC